MKQFIKLTVQHIPEKGFHLIRYYGFYSSKLKKKYEQARKYWQPLQEKRDKLSWRERQMCRNANDPEYKDKSYDPFICPECESNLELTKIIYPEAKYKRTIENIRIVLENCQKMKLDYG